MADARPPAAPQAAPFSLPASMLPFMTQSFGALPPQIQQQLMQSHLVLTQQQMQQLQQQGGLRPPASGAFPALPIPLATLPVPPAAAAPAGAAGLLAAGAVPGAVPGIMAPASAPKLGPPPPATSLPPPQPLTGVEGGAAAAMAAAAAEEPLVELPAAEFTHEQVIADPDLFLSTLMRLHIALGIAEKVPIMNSRPLDLHLLYRTVTAKGGMEEVVQRKAWKEVSSEFNFPETITSASFQLRKAYVALLWDYEQVYFKRKTGTRIPPPPGSYKTASSKSGGTTPGGVGAEGTTPKTGGGGGRGRKRKDPAVAGTGTPGGAGEAAAAAAAQSPPEYQGLPPGAPTALTAHATQPGAPEVGLVGSKGEVVVDAKFDCGYFVTVHLGTHEFRGMLYFPPPEHTRDAFALPPLPSSGGRKTDDPYLPRQPKSAFNFFAADARGKAKAAHPGLHTNELSKKLGEMWTAASEAEKAPYLELAAQDKRRYNAELEAYNYRLATNASLRQAHEAAAAVTLAQSALTGQALHIGGQLVGTPAQQAQQEEQDEAMQDAESGGVAGDGAADVAQQAQHVLPAVGAPLPFPLPGLPPGAVPIIPAGAAAGGAAPDAVAPAQ